MKQETILIPNRNDFKMSVRITKPENADKLAIIEHGFSGDKNENHMLILEKELAYQNYVVVNMDAIDSLNESEASPEGASFSGHYNDLIDVIEWAKTQEWYKEPFTLAGHSMGAASVLFYSEKFPNKVNLLLPISFPWLSGDSRDKQNGPEFMNEWKEKGYWDKFSNSRNRTLHVPYNFVEDLMKYDFLKDANKITAKTVLIIGDLENQIRLDDNNLLFNTLQCEKELIILPNTPHCTATTSENVKTYRETLQKVLK